MAVLEARGITKSFPGVVALDDVDVTFEPGRIHCLIGENGAGKSTLIKILTGVQPPDSGRVTIMGEDALKNKDLYSNVAYVPQEIDLFGHMSVAENLFIPYAQSGFKGATVNQGALQKAAQPWLDRFQITAHPAQLVKDISVSEQQLLQIARAMVNQKANILMLDEPTTSLSTDDTERLFEVILKIRDEGKAVIFISHKLEELFEIGDEVTVLRNGRKIDYAPVLADVDIPWLIEKMAGRVLDQNRTYHSEREGGDVLLRVNSLSGERFHNVSFELRRGEILGFSGLVGAGRSELMQGILGILPAWGGTVELDGEPLPLGNSRQSVRRGFIYLPEERKQHGILQYINVKENISISMLEKVRAGIGISGVKETKLAQEVVDQYNVKVSSLLQQIRYLSGGNQQKAIIGRAMYSGPKVLVFDEPTKGIDVGAKADIYALMKELAESGGMGIILVSSEMEEVQKCSNRIITMHRGRKAGEFPRTASKTDLLNSIMGVAGEVPA